MRFTALRFGNPVGPPRGRMAVVVAALLVVSGMGGCGGPSGGGCGIRGTGLPPGLQDIQSVAELEARFRADAGHPRLVMLLSPT